MSRVHMSGEEVGGGRGGQGGKVVLYVVTGQCYHENQYACLPVCPSHNNKNTRLFYTCVTQHLFTAFIFLYRRRPSTRQTLNTHKVRTAFLNNFLTNTSALTLPQIFNLSHQTGYGVWRSWQIDG